MLAIMKSLTQSVLGKFIAMIIIAGMAFWGVDSFVNQLRNGLGSNLLAAGSVTMDMPTLDRRVDLYLRNVNSNQDNDLVTKSDAAARGMVDQVFDVMKSRIQTLGYANKIGIRPSPEAMLAEVKKVEAFLNPLTGELDLASYQRVLRENRFSQAEYEDQVRDDLSLQMLLKGAEGGLIAPAALTDIQTRYLAESRDVAWFVLNASAAPAPAEPTEDEVRAFYDENIEVLKRPERRAIDMLKISADDFLSQVDVTEQEVATIYEAGKSTKFSEPEQRTYVELMFDTRDAARDAFAALAAGGDPAALEGVASRETRTAMADDIQDLYLKDALFGPGRQSGALFGPKDNGDGRWMVARLVSIQPGAVFPIETVSEEIRSDLARDRAMQLKYEKLEDLDRAIGAGYDLTQISAELGVPVISFLPVDRNGYTDEGLPMLGLMAAQDAFEQAFDAQIGETSNQFDAADATYVTAARRIIEASTPDFEEVKDDVRAALKMRNEGEAAQKMVKDLEARIKDGTSTLEAEAAKAGADIETPPGPVTRLTADQSGLPNSAISSVFASRVGDVFTVPNRTGELYLVVQLKAINDPSETDLVMAGIQASSALSSSLRSDMSAVLEQEMQEALRLRVNTSAFNAYKASLANEQ